MAATEPRGRVLFAAREAIVDHANDALVLTSDTHADERDEVVRRDLH
jgi:hypothetical protein